jgi:hypothetical protein
MIYELGKKYEVDGQLAQYVGQVALMYTWALPDSSLVAIYRDDPDLGSRVKLPEVKAAVEPLSRK